MCNEQARRIVGVTFFCCLGYLLKERFTKQHKKIQPDSRAVGAPKLIS